MTHIYCNLSTLRCSNRQLRGYEPLTAKALENVLNSQDPKLALKMAELSQQIGKHLVKSSPKNKADREFFDLYEAYRKISKEASLQLKGKEKKTKKETQAQKSLHTSFMQTALRVNYMKRLAEELPEQLFFGDDAISCPQSGVYTYLGARDALAFMQYQKQHGINFTYATLPSETKATIVLNTFAEYCQKCPHSFLNRVIMQALKREAEIEVLDQTTVVNKPKKIQKTLDEVLKDYLLFEHKLETLQIEDLCHVFERLEKRYQKGLMDSYTTVLAELFVAADIGDFSYAQLRDPVFLGQNLDTFYGRLENERVLNTTDLFLNCSTLKMFPPEFRYFKNLERIELYKCPMKHLSFKDQLKLKEVTIRNAKALESIDLANLKDLETILITSTKLKTLDFSKNKKLKDVHVTQSHLEEIQLGQNTALENLRIYSANLKEVDLTHLPRLSVLHLTNQRLKKVDLGHLKNLQELILGRNELSEVDLKENTKLKVLSVHDNLLREIRVNHLKELEHLDISTNQISSLDIVQNSRIQQLCVLNNPLKELNLSSCKGFLELDLDEVKGAILEEKEGRILILDPNFRFELESDLYNVPDLENE